MASAKLGRKFDLVRKFGCVKEVQIRRNQAVAAGDNPEGRGPCATHSHTYARTHAQTHTCTHARTHTHTRTWNCVLHFTMSWVCPSAVVLFPLQNVGLPPPLWTPPPESAPESRLLAPPEHDWNSPHDGGTISVTDPLTCSTGAQQNPRGRSRVCEFWVQ